jgi:uncharacterized membrane protein
MPSVSRKVSIKAPVEKVFGFVVNPENWTKYVTSLVDVKDVSSPGAEKGTTFRWTYRMVGLNFSGKGAVTENVKNKKFGLKMSGSFPIEETYTFSKSDEGTELDVEIQYDMPGKVLSLMPQKLIEKMNRKESEAVLGKIKIFCESA